MDQALCWRLEFKTEDVTVFLNLIDLWPPVEESAAGHSILYSIFNALEGRAHILVFSWHPLPQESALIRSAL